MFHQRDSFNLIPVGPGYSYYSEIAKSFVQPQERDQRSHLTVFRPPKKNEGRNDSRPTLALLPKSVTTRKSTPPWFETGVSA